MPDDDLSRLDAFVARALDALGLDEQVDRTLLLDLSREVAHGVARPAAPVSTYLLGLAVGRGMPVDEAADRLRGAV